MAIYHFSVKPISRGDGRSAVAAAAYRSAQKLNDQRYGKVQDYERKSGVEISQIYAPTEVAPELLNRNELWNKVEKSENRKDACLAREFEIAFPKEFNKQQRKAMLDELCNQIVNKYYVIVDASIHAPHTESGSDERNFHAHIMFTTRAIDPSTGLFASKKYRDFNKELGSKTTSKWREDFAILTNKHLKIGGFESRVDHRSFKEQGLNFEPTLHEGPKVTQLRRRGINTELSMTNDDIKKIRIELKEENKRLIHIEQDIKTASNILVGLEEEKRVIQIVQKRVSNFPSLYNNFLDDWNFNQDALDQNIFKQVQLLEKHDIYEISMQYAKDFELLKKYGLEPKPTFWKKLKNTFIFSEAEKTYIDIVNNNLNNFFPTCFEEYAIECKAEATKKEQVQRKKIEDQKRVEQLKWLEDQKQKRELEFRQKVELMLNQNYAKNLDYELEQSSYFSNINYLIRNIKTELHFIANKEFDDYKRSLKERYSEFSELFSLNNKIISLNESTRIKILKLVDDDKLFIEKHYPAALRIIEEFQAKVAEKYDRQLSQPTNFSYSSEPKFEKTHDNDFSI